MKRHTICLALLLLASTARAFVQVAATSSASCWKTR